MFKERFPSSAEPVNEAEQKLEEGKKFAEARFQEIQGKYEALNARKAERGLKEQIDHTAEGYLLNIKNLYEQFAKQPDLIGTDKWDAVCLWRAETPFPLPPDTKSGVAKECPRGAGEEPLTLQREAPKESERLEEYLKRTQLVRKVVMEELFQDRRKAEMFTGENEEAMWERLKKEKQDIRWQTDMPGIDIIFTERDRIAEKPTGSHLGTTRAIMLKFYEPEKLEESI